MDSVRTIEGDAAIDNEVALAEPRMEPPPAIGKDERRMHVRAYNYWVSLLDGRTFPSIADLDPQTIADFGTNSVLLDFGGDPGNPLIPFLGSALREEGGHVVTPQSLADVPARSLISRLTDHYLEIIANRAPIGFEAEFVNLRGHNTLYRGILMPFSSDGVTIDFVYGVINWKEIVDQATVASIVAEVTQVLAHDELAGLAAWADGPYVAPRASVERVLSEAIACEPALIDTGPASDEDPLADTLAEARECAEVLRGTEGRSRAALYRALGLAYDFALLAEARPDDYADLLEDAGLKAQARAPMTPLVKLVFGIGYDKTRLTEFAAALSHGRRCGLGAGALRPFLEGFGGGIKGVVAAERAARRPAPGPDPRHATRDRLRRARARAWVEIDTGDAEFVVLLARRDGDRLAVLGASADAAFTDRVAKAIRDA